MSKHYKPGAAASPFTSPAAPLDVHPNERQRILSLIASQHSDRALDVAKALHKRCNNAESESLLLDAYGARLEALTARKLDREAAAARGTGARTLPFGRRTLAHMAGNDRRAAR